MREIEGGGEGVFPSKLEEYVEECVAYNVGLPLSDKALRERLAATEEARKELRQQVDYLQQRLGDALQKLSRTKVEANLNAQAVKKHIEENQRIAEQWRKVCDECARLEKECALYAHDREVFMEAADEAEERAHEAEQRALNAHTTVQQLLAEIDHLKHGIAHSSSVSKAKVDDELSLLRSRVKELESANRNSQNEAVSTPTPVKKRREDSSVNRRIEQLERENRELRALLEVATIRSKEYPSGLQNCKQGSKEGNWEDKLFINSMVSSAVAKGSYKVTEQEKQEVTAKICSSIEAFIKEEFRGRIEASEKTSQLLLAEVQSLRQEKNHIKSNLEKAEVEVQLLDDENKELRLRLRGRFQGSDGHIITTSPLQTKVKASCSPTSQVKSPENICDLHGNDNLRQPLSPLAHNSVESKMHHK